MSKRYSLEAVFNLIDKVTKPLNDIEKKTNGLGERLKKDFAKGNKQLEKLGKAAKKTGLAIAAAGAAAVTAWAVKGVKDAIAYDSALRKVATAADLTAVSMGDLSAGLMKVSNFTGVAVTELAEMQYAAIVSGVKTADSVGFIETAVKTAKAAFTDTGTVIDSLTAVLNAYGMEASAADKIAGQMYITNKLGKTSFEELNSSLGSVLPTAARLGVETDELFASIAALTAGSIETPKAMKGVLNILKSVQNPSTKAAKAARQLGIDFSAAALRSKGLAGFLKEIKVKTGGSEQAIIDLFGSVEALNAVMALTETGADNFAHALAEMQGGAQAVDRAFDIVASSPAERMSRLMNKIKNAGIKLGTALMPLFEKIAEKFEKMADKLEDFDFQPVADKIAEVFNWLSKLGSYVMDFIGIVWDLRTPILAVMIAVGAYKAVMLAAAAASSVFSFIKGVYNAVMLVACFVTGNQTKAMALYQAGTAGAAAQTFLFTLRQKIAMALDFAKNIIGQAKAFVVLKARLIGAKIATIGHTVAQKASMALGFVKNILSMAKAFVLLKARMIGAKIATIAFSIAQKAAAVAGKIWTGIQWLLNAAMAANPIVLIILAIGALIAGIIALIAYWDDVVEAIGNAFSAIGDFFGWLWDSVKNIAGEAWEGIKNIASNTWGGIKSVFGAVGGFFKDVWGGAKNIAEKAWEGIKNAASNAWEGIKNIFGAVGGFFKGVWDGVKNIAGKAWDGIKSIAGKAWGGIKSVFGAVGGFFGDVWGGVKNIAGKAWDGVKNAASTAWGGIKSVFGAVGGFFKDVWSGAKDTAEKAWSGIKNAASNAWDGIKNVTGSTWDKIDELTGGGLTRFKEGFLNAFAKVKEGFSNLIDKIKEGWEKVKGFFGRVGGAVKDFFTGGPAKVENITKTANTAVPAFRTLNTTSSSLPTSYAPQLISPAMTAASRPPAMPMTTAERYIYSQTTNRDAVDIMVRAEQGSTAKVTRPPVSPNVSVLASGGNR